MTEFRHSMVLFTGDDGLPLQFNIRNTSEKTDLRAKIEHGGGLCSQTENAVHLISPGTKVLNADLGKKLVSSKYVHDCVEKNYLLDVNDYVFIISEAQMTDISDESSQGPELMNYEGPGEKPLFDGQLNLRNEPGPDENFKFAPKLTSQNSTNSSESFVECSVEFSKKVLVPNVSHGFSVSDSTRPFASTGKLNEDENQMKLTCLDFQDVSPILPSQISQKRISVVSLEEDDPILNSLKQSDNLAKTSSNEIFPSPKQLNQLSKDEHSYSMLSKKQNLDISKSGNSSFLSPNRAEEKLPKVIGGPLPISVINQSPLGIVVSSSQSTIEGLDKFDQMLLNRSQQKDALEDEESLSQSCTVSSSADALVSSKSPLDEITSGELLTPADSPLLPADLSNDCQASIRALEAEVEMILQKPPPKSIQDKICLVKYICIAKKLPPATVLQTLNNL